VDRIRVHYEVRGPAAEIAARAEALALEQSVEVPRGVVRDERSPSPSAPPPPIRRRS